MKTQIYDLTDKSVYNDAILSAAAAIKGGGTVVFPTETVYGIGADAFNEDAIKKIFNAKNRPLDNPLIVHLSSADEIYNVAESMSPDAEKAAQRFMPGPITIVTYKKPCIPPAVTAGLNTVAIRVPLRQSARDLIRAAGTPIVAPSANISGKPSPTAPQHVIDDMDGKVDVILIEGNCDVGLESTVVDFAVEGAARILRPGGVTPEQLKKTISLEENYRPSYITDEREVPKAPGMKYKHYKPNASVVCLIGNEEKIVNYINEKAPLAGDGAAAAVFEHLKNKVNCAHVFSLGDVEFPEQAGNLLFYVLRKADEVSASKIYVMSPNDTGIGLAYQNRLKKASDEVLYFN